MCNGWPIGVAVNAAMHHGGPWPATTSPLHTSVGTTAIRRFLRPIAFQGWPEELLPEELRGVRSLPGLRWIDDELVDAADARLPDAEPMGERPSQSSDAAKGAPR